MEWTENEMSLEREPRNFMKGFVGHMKGFIFLPRAMETWKDFKGTRVFHDQMVGIWRHHALCSTAHRLGGGQSLIRENGGRLLQSFRGRATGGRARLGCGNSTSHFPSCSHIHSSPFPALLCAGTGLMSISSVSQDPVLVCSWLGSPMGSTGRRLEG